MDGTFWSAVVFPRLSLLIRVNISLICSAGTALGRLQQEEWEFQAQAILGYMVSSSQIRSQKTSPLTKQTKNQNRSSQIPVLTLFEWQASICCLGWLLLTVFVCCVLDELSFWWGHVLFKYCGMVFSLVLRFTAHSLAFLARSLFSTLTERIDSLSWPWAYELYLIKTYKVDMGIHSGSEFKKCEIVCIMWPTWFYTCLCDESWEL